MRWVSTNWAGNVTFSATRTEHPGSVDEVRRLVAGARTVRAVGTGHSFSRIADTTGTQVALDAMPEVFEVGDRAVRVDAGMRLARLAELLQARRLALPAMPSLPHISVAGATATATHGSGNDVPSLASLVRRVELVTAEGEPVTFARGEEGFDGAVVAFGTLGVVTHVELEVVDTFDVEQRVYDDVPLDALAEDFDAIFGSAYSVSAFTGWNGRARVFAKHRVGDERRPLRVGRDAPEARHPVEGQPPHRCTAQLGVPGPWHERLPHFRADFLPSVGEELQAEYFVPREHAGRALRALEGLRDELAPFLLTSEIRTVAAETQWMSMVHDRPSAAFHFTLRPDEVGVRAVLRRVEEALLPFDPRPHWGKVTELPDVAGRYPRARDFAELRARLDPTGKFRDDAVDGRFTG
ncbi:FAD-binding protein [Saccharothrix yanglingensis]|uniref:FAD-binding protein n=1 Tax=Saccharothrix yanglingensis TaxID=659496 RepID=A0ABU0X8W1_9PSEU|nr:FAD-binding protein [Saccharothrix yanglingensis]